MYKVLIAEDEMLVRTGIRVSIEWEKFHMYVVGEAANGQAAWELYQKEVPDLVLTDIRMPFMDGIELIRRIRSTQNPTQIIILSCLDDFALAKEAIHLGVCGYILKLTMTPEEMEEVLSAAQKALDHSSRTSSIAPANIQDVLEHHLLSHLTYDVPTLSACLSTLREYQIPLYSHDLVISLMRIDQYQRLQDIYHDSQGQLIQFSILNIISEILSRNDSGLVIHESGARYLLLFHSSSETRSMHRILTVLEEILTVLGNYFNVTPHFYVSEMAQELTRLRPLYQQCVCMDKLCFFIAPGTVNYYSSSWKNTLWQSIHTKTRQRLASLQDQEFCRQFLLDPLQELLPRSPSSLEILNLFYDAYIASLHNHRPQNQESYDSIRDFLIKISSCADYYSMLNYFAESVHVLEDHSGGQNRCSREIVKALQYIQSYYPDSLTLPQIAQIAGLSPNYFSSLFKKEMGSSFLEYLNRYRIEKSMELLLNTSLKTYEIAWKCGFSDEGYFGKTFKKYTGMTPNEYKKNCTFTQ